MPTKFDSDVAIVGLGPVGGILAILLGQRGWSVTVLEREPSVFPAPRAVHFDGEVMRVLQVAGLADRLGDTVMPVRGMDMLGVGGEVIFTYRATDDDPSGWDEGYMFEQPALEALQRARIAELPNVTVQLGHEVTQIDRELDDVGQGVRVRGRSGNVDFELRSRYLVGCGGGRSITRTAIESEIFDYGVDQRWLVVDIVLNDADALPALTIQYCEPDRPSTYVPLPGARRRFELLVLPDESAETITAPAEIERLLARWLEPDSFEIDRSAVYTFHGLVANRWREGPVMIAGDAAHQMPPFLGQGMCAGYRDAANLEWKLDAVLRGQSDPALLDSYQPEREAHVRRIIETDLYLADLIQTMDVEKAEARDREATREGKPSELKPKPYPIGRMLAEDQPATDFQLPQFKDARGIRLDDVMGSGFALIGHLDVPESTEAWLQKLGITRVTKVPGPLAGWLEAQGSKAVLVRPDRYVMATLRSCDALGPILDRISDFPGRAIATRDGAS